MVAREDHGGFTAAFDREAYTRALLDQLLARDVDLVCMAGFGTILAPSFFDALEGRVLNTHPSLLPAYRGWHAVRDALADGATTATGCTVHVATTALDDGPILAQEAVEVRADDDEASLHARIKAVEQRLYPEVIQRVRDALAAGGSTGVARTPSGRGGPDEGPPQRLGQAGPRRARPRARGARRRAGRVGRDREGARGGRRSTHLEVAALTGSPEMLSGRVKTLHPKLHGGILATWTTPRTSPTSPRRASRPSTSSSATSTRSGRTPRSSSSTSAARRWCARRRRTTPTWASSSTPTTTPPSSPSSARTARSARRRARASRARRSRTPPPTTRRSSPGSTPRSSRRRRAAPTTLHVTLERAEALRYGENPHQRGARYRLEGRPSFWDGVVQHGGRRAQLPQPVRRRRRVAPRPRAGAATPAGRRPCS